MAKQPDVASVPQKFVEDKHAIPAHLQGLKKTVRAGNLDQSDLIIPRVKILQAVDPILQEREDLRAGMFFNTAAEESMGKELRGIPIIVRKSWVLWAPRNDDRGILARSNDAVNWDKPNEEFEVVLKSKKKVKWATKGSVAESGLDKFGSSDPDDPNSPPAASLTYQIMWYFTSHPDLSPSVILNTRSSVKAARSLLTKMEMRPVDHYYQAYTIEPSIEQSDDGPYYSYKYMADGYADEQTAALTKSLFDKFGSVDWQPSEDEPDPTAEKESSKGNYNEKMASKF